MAIRSLQQKLNEDEANRLEHKIDEFLALIIACSHINSMNISADKDPEAVRLYNGSRRAAGKILMELLCPFVPDDPDQLAKTDRS